MAGIVKITQPKDESLPAYKKWVIMMTEHVTGKKQSESSMTEKEWESAWKEFWGE